MQVGPVIADLKSCWEKIVLRRKTVKDTRVRWSGAETVASSTVGEDAPRTTVRISDVVEVGDFQYIEEHNKLDRHCCSRSLSSPAQRKKRRVPVSPVAAKKNSSLLKVRVLFVPHFKLLWRRVLRIRVQEEVITIGPMPQSSRGYMITSFNCIFLKTSCICSYW